MLNLKRKQKKLKEPVPSGKKKSTKLETLGDLERALSESKDTASAVCGLRLFSNWSFFQVLCLCLPLMQECYLPLFCACTAVLQKDF